MTLICEKAKPQIHSCPPVTDLGWTSSPQDFPNLFKEAAKSKNLLSRFHRFHLPRDRRVPEDCGKSSLSDLCWSEWESATRTEQSVHETVKGFNQEVK
ncbi:uncharacterized [Tachysurus ichikawai]